MVERRTDLEHAGVVQALPGNPPSTHVGHVMDPRLMIQIFQGKHVPNLYDLAHVAG